MCIPHGATSPIDNGYIEKKPKKHIEKVSQEIFEKGDPDFVDERVFHDDKTKKAKSLFERIFGTDTK